jgi:myo-inositol-1-phosphate synthase
VQVIASSNHLGNNDMRNLTSKRTLDAKMRVKSNIFEPWQEDIDHQVAALFNYLKSYKEDYKHWMLHPQ